MRSAVKRMMAAGWLLKLAGDRDSAYNSRVHSAMFHAQKSVRHQ